MWRVTDVIRALRRAQAHFAGLSWSTIFQEPDDPLVTLALLLGLVVIGFVAVVVMHKRR
jgi:hypothetical protein